MEDLEKLLIFLQNEFDNINNEWVESDKYKPLNMKKLRVDHVYKNQKLLVYILNYRNFINEHAVDLMRDINLLNLNNIVNSRVKNLNSIQFKIDSYEKKPEKGKIPIKKCMNDLYGIRMIFNEDISYEIIKNFVTEKFPHLKCTLSNKGEYVATHIYFGNDDNKKFQWELQLWDKKHEQSNFNSHAKYKQAYTKWESENI